MSSLRRPSFNALACELIRRGIPFGYVCRVVGELRDHAHDLASGGTGNSAALGDPRVLADEITQTYRSRSFAGRHPCLTFALLPLPLTLLTYVLCFVIGILFTGLLAEVLVDEFDFVLRATIVAGHVAFMMLPSMLCTWLICRWARRAGLDWRGTCAACLPVLLMALLLISKVSWPSPDEGTVAVGFWLPLGYFGPAFGPQGWPAFHWRQALQVAVPLLAMTWLMAREAGQRRALHVAEA